VDGAPVAAATVSLTRVAEDVIASFVVSTTGGPTTYDMRAAIEITVDGGTTWHQVCRFKDITNAQTLNQIVRASGLAAISSADIAASALGSAAAAAAVADSPWPASVRAVTKLQTLAGGATPHVIALVTLETR
jgi:hypothetical protein